MPTYRVTVHVVEPNMISAHSLIFCALDENKVNYTSFEIEEEK